MQAQLRPRHHPDYRYPGLRRDTRSGLTDLGTIILDARLFGLIREDEDCRGWPLARIRALYQPVREAWASYQDDYRLLPGALQLRYLRIREHWDTPALPERARRTNTPANAG